MGPDLRFPEILDALLMPFIDCLGDYLLFGDLFLFTIGSMSGIHWSL